MRGFGCGLERIKLKLRKDLGDGYHSSMVVHTCPSIKKLSNYGRKYNIFRIFSKILSFPSQNFGFWILVLWKISTFWKII